jgi:hypothetical protein
LPPAAKATAPGTTVEPQATMTMHQCDDDGTKHHCETSGRDDGTEYRKKPKSERRKEGLLPPRPPPIQKESMPSLRMPRPRRLSEWLPTLNP